MELSTIESSRYPQNLQRKGIGHGIYISVKEWNVDDEE